jgi:hypothetical protein
MTTSAKQGHELRDNQVSHESFPDPNPVWVYAQLKRAVRRSQLPVIATHSTYRYTQDAKEIATMAKEHGTIFDLLLAGDADSAASALEAHLKRAVEHNVGLLENLPSLPDKELPPYLVRA